MVFHESYISIHVERVLEGGKEEEPLLSTITAVTVDRY